MNRLIKTLEKMNIEISPETLEKFQGYMEDILELNEHINLTAIRREDEFIEKHYLDSVVLGQFEEIKKAGKILDLGTGAGFPGIPLALLFPEKEFVLVDSLNKRLKIIDELCQKYSINNVTLIHGRAEELGRKPELRDGFDLCISRAVASMPVLAEYCLPFVKVGGMMVAYKGPDASIELEKAAKAIRLLSGELDRVENVKIMDSDLEHNLVFIKKTGRTPKAYPRKPGTPAKEPLQ